jgi:hypothetical protein
MPECSQPMCPLTFVIINPLEETSYVRCIPRINVPWPICPNPDRQGRIVTTLGHIPQHHPVSSPPVNGSPLRLARPDISQIMSTPPYISPPVQLSISKTS